MKLITLFAFFSAFTLASALEFVTLPVDQNVHQGEQAEFEVQVSGNPPFTYSWYLGGVLQEGVNSAKFTTSPLALSNDRTEVICFVEDAAHRSITSKPVYVRVLPVSSKVMTLDGQLNLANGAGDFDVDLKVSLFTSISGGTPVYTETFDKDNKGMVEVRNGRFQVRLGLDDGGIELQQVVKANQSLYVEFQLGVNLGQETLAPRLPLTAFPFALSER